MHREIQIKQFPIVTTHWWPKTRNERFCVRKPTVFISFLPCTQPCPSDLSAHTSGVWRVCVTCVCARSGSRCIHTGRRRQRLTEGVSEAWCWRNFSSANGGISQSDRLMQIPNPLHSTPEKYVIGCCNYDGASAPRFRHALRQALTPTSQSARAHTHVTHTHTRHTHTSHTGCVCALRSLGHGCVQEVKNDINTVRFLTQTARFVS